MIAGPSRWWENATADEVAECRDVVYAFLTDPDSANREKSARALALLVLLGGDGDRANIRDEVNKVEDSQLDEVCNGLEVFEERLSDFPVPVPDGLRESIDHLKERRQKRSEDITAKRMENLLRHARTYKFKLKTKG
jgi:hypothetical protein